MNLCVDMALVPSAPLFLWSLLLLAIIVHIFKVFSCHLGNLLTCSCPHYPSVPLSPFSGMGPMYLPSGPAHQTILPFFCLLPWWTVSLCCVNQIWLKTKIWFQSICWLDTSIFLSKNSGSTIFYSISSNQNRNPFSGVHQFRLTPPWWLSSGGKLHPFPMITSSSLPPICPFPFIIISTRLMPFHRFQGRLPCSSYPQWWVILFLCVEHWCHSNPPHFLASFLCPKSSSERSCPISCCCLRQTSTMVLQWCG